MDKELIGMASRRALVTGASSGIGRVLAKLMAEKGYRVLAVARRRERLEDLARETGGAVSYLAVDLADPGSLDAIEAAVREMRGLEVLVNNAGFAVARGVLEQSPEEIEAQFLVNAVRPLQLVRRLVKYMGEGGVVVNVVTAGVHVVLAGLPVYGASKAALHYADRELRGELEARGIRLVEVLPGPVRTEFFRRAGLSEPRWAVSAEAVARAILGAVEKGRDVVYVPFYLGFMRLFDALPPSFY